MVASGGAAAAARASLAARVRDLISASRRSAADRSGQGSQYTGCTGPRERAGGSARIVGSQAAGQVVGDAGVQRIVGAAQDIDAPGSHPALHLRTQIFAVDRSVRSVQRLHGKSRLPYDPIIAFRTTRTSLCDEEAWHSVSYADLLLLGIPLALYFDYVAHNPLLAFVFSAMAVLRLAAWMGHATEQVAIHMGPRIGGFLNGTFGNAAELIIVIMAIRQGLYEVVKASITGSILGNALLVLGAALLAGGLRHESQHFNRTLARHNASLLYLVMVALAIPAVFHMGPMAIPQTGLERLSLWAAVILLALYIFSLIFSFRTHAHLFHTAGGHEEKAEWSKGKSMLILLAATALVVLMSEVLVASIEPVMEQLHWSELFVGVVVVALVGNAAEHSTAITMAWRNRMDAAIEIAIGSTTQIALLVAPLAVLVSCLFGRPMSLEFIPAELVAILVSVLTVNQITRDGETNWLEGVMLLSAYAIMAAAFYFVPVA